MRAHGGHAWLAVGAGAHALPFRQAHGAADHFLRQGEAGFSGHRHAGQAKQGRGRQTQELARLGCQRAADDQVDAPTSAHFVKQHIALELELGNGLAVLDQLALVRQHVDHVAHLQLAHVDLNGERAGVFLGVEEDGGDLAAQSHTAKALVRYKGDVLAGGPDH